MKLERCASACVVERAEEQVRKPEHHGSAGAKGGGFSHRTIAGRAPAIDFIRVGRAAVPAPLG